MVTISTIILALTLAPIIIDALLGLMRGRNRSILRLILVVVSAVVAIFAIKPIIGAVMGIEVEGQPLKEYVASMLTQGEMQFPPEITNLLFMIVEMILSVILYFVIFLVVKFVTWAILFPILKIFVRKGEHKGHLTGLLVGLLQGVIVAFLVCAPITGVIGQVGKITSLNMDAVMPASEGGDTQMEMPDLGIDEYLNSPLYKVYSSTGEWLFDMVSSTTDENGNKVTLSGTIDAFVSIIDLAGEAQTITDNINVLLESEPTPQQLSNALQGLGDSLVTIGDGINSLDDSSKAIINELIGAVGDLLGGSEDASEIPPEVIEMFENFDINNLKLASAGHAINGIASYFEKTSEDFDAYGQAVTQEEVNNIINGFADNPYVLTMLAGDNPEQVDSLIEVDSEHAEMFNNAISSNTNLSDEQKEIMKKLFAL